MEIYILTYPLTEILADNIQYYKCDVSKWEEVLAVSKQIIEEVCMRLCCLLRRSSDFAFAGWRPHYHCE